MEARNADRIQCDQQEPRLILRCDRDAEIVHRREVKTEVSVASGATIGMGGLIGEKTEAFSDRVPVLGSIPLIGRLFRSEGNRTIKRNLMIFVTASKVSPSGRIISEQSFEK